MTEKDEPNNIFDDTLFSNGQSSKKNPAEGPNEPSDNDEEIIELADPDETSSAELEEEVIEPADFLDELTEDETNFAAQRTGVIPPADNDDDIIELTDAAEAPAEGTRSANEASSSGGPPPSDDKDLFIFTDSQDEAIIQDGDILSDTVFANELPPEDGQATDTGAGIPPQETKDTKTPDNTIFDNTIFAKEPSEDNDQELAVLTEIDEKPPQIENGMLNDTVFSSDSNESLGNSDEELAVLTELDESPEPPTDQELANIDSDVVLLDDTQAETAIEKEDDLIQLDSETMPESVPLELESTQDSDIADSLGMNLETNASLSQNAKEIDEVELTIEPDLDGLKPEATPFESETPIDMSVNTAQMDQFNQSTSSEPIHIQPGQLEEAVERVIVKLFSGKIDSMIMDVIEKVVKTDIEKIKKELLKGTMVDL
jgi:hypothetical protein